MAVPISEGWRWQSNGRGVAYGGARRWWQGGVGSGDVQGGKGEVGAARARPEAAAAAVMVAVMAAAKAAAQPVYAFGWVQGGERWWRACCMFVCVCVGGKGH